MTASAREAMSIGMAASVRCSSSGDALTGRGSTHFKCPNCAEVEIGRCPRCRDQSVPYRCSNCGFEGP